MRWPQNAFSLLILGVLFALPTGVLAQMNWAQIGTPTTIGIRPHTMDAADGIVVVGGNGLAITTNNGATWRNITPNISNNPNFVGIAIYDRNIFAVQSGVKDIYITSDQGMSWRPILYGSPVTTEFPLVFMNDPQKILFTTDGGFIYTTDGGNTFTTSMTTLNPYQLKLAADGTVRAFSRTPNDVRTASSSDNGRTWVESALIQHHDCFSIIMDPFNPSILCLVNEDFYLRQYQCMIFRTSDNGWTWDTTFRHSLSYLAGSSDRGCTDYFAGTVSEGILRSTDQGLSWHGIGGPSVAPDYRNLVAADDSLLFAIDQGNNVWASRPVSNTWKIKVRNLISFANTDIVTCDSVRTGMVIVYPGCDNSAVDRVDIVGLNAASYSFLDSVDATLPDTIMVRFVSDGIGETHATLKVKLEDGTDHEFDLSAKTIAPEITIHPEVLMEDSIIFCETLLDTITIASPCPMAITDLRLSGIDSASFSIVGPASRSLPGDSTIIIVCNPQHLGRLDAQLRITTQFGKLHSVFLRPTINRVPLAVFFDTIWARDTLWKCQQGFDTIRLRSGCSIGDIELALTDSSNYRIIGKRSISLPQDSMIVVEYFPIGKDDIRSYLTFRSSTLDSVNVPLRRSFKRGPIGIKNLSEVFSDTVSICKTLIDTLIFYSPCPHTATNIHFEGPDAVKFKIISNPQLKLPSDSMLIISCSATQPGQLNADLVFESEDRIVDRYRLQPVFITAPFQFKPTILFNGDSLGACIGGFDTLRVSSDCAIKIKSISITGTDAASFSLLTSAPLQLPGDSTIIVQCRAGAKGRRTAALRIELEDGRTWSVQLSALIVDAPIKIVPAALFTSDTISKCSYALDTLRLIAPCALNIKNISIQGPDAALFRIEGINPLVLPKDSIIIVRFTPGNTGPVTAYFRVEAADGRVWTVPFAPKVVESQVRISQSTLFISDTILSCATTRDSVVVSVDCPLALSSITITGNDASSFSIVGPSSIVIPADRQITVLCTPSRSGQLDAELQLQGEDGRTWQVMLSIFVEEISLQLSKNSLFDNDSIYSCSTISDTISLMSQCPVDLVNISISGTDVESFSADLRQLVVNGQAKISVSCTPVRAGALDAQLDIHSADGRQWNIPMSPYSKASEISVTQSSLFEKDSFSICEWRSDTISLSSICPSAITEVRLVGPDGNSFTVSGKQNLSLPEDSTVLIVCNPTRAGKLDASLEFIAADGKVFSVLLSPFIEDRAIISLGTITDFSTDTLGGDIYIPISLNRSSGRSEIEFSMYSDPSVLEFVGVFDNAGVDKTVERSPGESRVIAQVEGTTELLARYLYFPATTDCTELRIDSIQIANSSEACLTNLTSGSTINICAPGFCGRNMLSELLRGKKLDLRITPNPSQGFILLYSGSTNTTLSVQLVDANGVVRKSFDDLTVTPTGTKLDISDLSSGTYEVSASSPQYQEIIRLVLVK